MRAAGIFVSGTDTGVGKTTLACALAMWCRKQKIEVGVMKPVSTGGREDALLLQQAAGSKDSLELINPVYFKEPLAPWTAALRAKSAVSLKRLDEAYRVLSSRHDFLIVEGIGGLLVPLNKNVMIADVARRWGLPVLLVSRPALGTLNHTLLSLACLKQNKMSCRGVIVNAHSLAPKDPLQRLSVKTNPPMLKRLTPHFLGSFSFQRHFMRAGRLNPRLADSLETALGKRALLRLVKG